MGSSAAGVAELVGPRVMAAEAWRSELNAVVAAVGKVGIAAAVAEEEDDDCDGIVVTLAAAVASSPAATLSAEWKQCAGGGETWQSEKPSDLQRAC